MELKPKIAVAMSGGVDSSVAALILKNEGYDVVGVNLHLWSCFKGSKSKTCCSPEDRLDARNVCEAIGIPFHSIDMREEFNERIIKHFVEEYSRGRTPNPCIRCNTLIKFDSLIRWVKKELNIDFIATGHYARIVRGLECHPEGALATEGSHVNRGRSFVGQRPPQDDIRDKVHLLRGVDPEKDQSYFLYDITPETLAKIGFPLGEYTKAEARKIAEDAGLPVAEKAESQEVCFIPDNDFASFIEDFYPDYARPAGNFVDKDGRVLGKHRGTHAYTIGQRRGLGIGFGERRYVTDIRPESGEVLLGEDSDIFKTECTVENLNMLEDVGDEFDAEVKIRYKSDPVPARCHREVCCPSTGSGRTSRGTGSGRTGRGTGSGRTSRGTGSGRTGRGTPRNDKSSRAVVRFEKPVRAITPGQAAVFYKDDLVLGGGWIV